MGVRNTVAEDLMDNDNLQRTERLKYKVSQLKSFAIDIESETKEHNTLLDSIDGDLDGVHGFIHGSKSRVNRLLASGKSNRRLMCYVTVAGTFFLIFTYYLISKSLSSSKT